MLAVIQAGGKGTRLRPYTLVVPKPLMPLDDQAIIEVLLKWLYRWGITRVIITLGYLGHLIRALCGDGRQWNMEISYSEEQEPLGTIGPLRLIKEHLTETFLVLNGDLITDMNLCAFASYHIEWKAPVTVAVTNKPVAVDLGVLESQNNRLVRFREKPTLNFQVSMGIYCMEPSVLELIPRNVPFGFDDLMHSMLGRNVPVHLFQHDGLWLDIGREEDFCHAQNSFAREYKMRVLGC